METFISFISAFGLGAIISGVVVTWVEKKLEQNSENRMRLLKQREAQYSSFLTNVLGFRSGWEHPDSQRSFLFDLYTSATVSASDKVYRLARDYVNSFDKTMSIDELEREKIYSKLVIAIRNELNELAGVPHTSLKESDIQIKKLD